MYGLLESKVTDTTAQKTCILEHVHLKVYSVLAMCLF